MIYAAVTEVEFCVIPLDNFEAHNWKVYVRLRKDDLYYVEHRSYYRLSHTGKWHSKYTDIARSEKWQKNHTFSFTEACALARHWAPKVTSMGLTGDQYTEWCNYIDAGGKLRPYPWALDKGYVKGKVKA